ncbi:MAG: EAL domain-containing protein, partial [Burkholderiaceae bacterium]
TLKVDQTFVKDMVRSESDEQIVRSVIGLAHQCKLLVVAEGVEDEATLAALLGMHCDLAQGYLIAHPMKTEDASAWLKEHDVDSNNFSFLNEKDRERFISNGAAD